MANPESSGTVTDRGALKRDSNEHPVGWTYRNMASQATLTVKSGAGVLHAITFNKPVATSTLALYDNTAGSGTLIGTITVPASPQPSTLLYDVAFSTGLTAIMGTADMDVTFSYI